ncbi:hypothetical protein M438DRAFT_158426 [Aureobasidium pullulans EXF-150]|uniref:Uncharacterized protein n=1 Tax=Aureobasidium pullulans EXF-150 TaxID=1043002 RepID=A0A074YIZ3_AURPU|nr:uncharacterized protein M438DRAFT_158426 [Aureobasidium pullulans EXF-150]KEQ86881.1 hypothetical protein M438DRAFT_158426 [Aureobasidium pullulans EXF-150]
MTLKLTYLPFWRLRIACLARQRLAKSHSSLPEHVMLFAALPTGLASGLDLCSCTPCCKAFSCCDKLFRPCLSCPSFACSSSLLRACSAYHTSASLFLNEDGHPRPALRASHRVRINILLSSFQPA